VSEDIHSLLVAVPNSVARQVAPIIEATFPELEHAGANGAYTHFQNYRLFFGSAEESKTALSAIRQAPHHAYAFPEGLIAKTGSEEKSGQLLATVVVGRFGGAAVKAMGLLTNQKMVEAVYPISDCHLKILLSKEQLSALPGLLRNLNKEQKGRVLFVRLVREHSVTPLQQAPTPSVHTWPTTSGGVRLLNLPRSTPEDIVKRIVERLGLTEHAKHPLSGWLKFQGKFVYTLFADQPLTPLKNELTATFKVRGRSLTTRVVLQTCHKTARPETSRAKKSPTDTAPLGKGPKPAVEIRLPSSFAPRATATDREPVAPAASEGEVVRPPDHQAAATRSHTELTTPTPEIHPKGVNRGTKRNTLEETKEQGKKRDTRPDPEFRRNGQDGN
jgi:hypothetical protein